MAPHMSEWSDPADDGPFTIIDVESIDRDEGTVIVFFGHRVDNHRPARFAADHRSARAIVDALARGNGAAVRVALERWQLL